MQYYTLLYIPMNLWGEFKCHVQMYTDITKESGAGQYWGVFRLAASRHRPLHISCYFLTVPSRPPPFLDLTERGTVHRKLKEAIKFV